MQTYNPLYIARIIAKHGPGYVVDAGIKYMANYTKHWLLSPLYLQQLQNLPQTMSIAQAVDFVNFGCFEAFKPLQIESEVTALLKAVSKLKPKYVVEIGTANGGTFFCLAKASAPNATLVSIDLPAGEFGGGYPRYKIPLLESFAGKKQKVKLIRADSHKLETKQMLVQALSKHKIDFLMIDGDHTYEGAKKDFELYSPLVRKGGLIAFHDIVVHAKEMNCGVSTLWKELSRKHRHQTYVENWKQGLCGIGVIKM